jgi:hypothetical protein
MPKGKGFTACFGKYLIKQIQKIADIKEKQGS